MSAYPSAASGQPYARCSILINYTCPQTYCLGYRFDPPTTGKLHIYPRPLVPGTDSAGTNPHI